MLERSARLGPYEVLGRIGAGGMGEVYRARDSRLGREVAIKILPEGVARDADRIARFEREARALAALSHPNVLAIHDFGREGDLAYAVTELLEGETLRERLQRDRPTWRRAAEIAAGIADALAAAHAHHIVHRDLKPENVFLTSDGRLKVLDFGLAKVVEPARPEASTLTSPHSTSEGHLVGTVSYMSPEQARGLAVDSRSDIFSLGCVLYEMLGGHRPFDRPTIADTISAILHEEPPPLDGTGAASPPPSLVSIVSRCLEKEPADRFHSAHDLALSLRSLSGAGGKASAGGTRTRRLAGKWVLGSAAGAAAVAFAVVVALPLFRPPHGASRVWTTARPVTTLPGWEVDPAVSPDGSLVAFASNASGNVDIWLVEAAGGEARQLTDVGVPQAEAPDDFSPTWLPDGRSILFSSDRTGQRSIFRVSFLGGSPRLVAEDADEPALSVDGTLLAFTRPLRSGHYRRIWIAPLADPARARPLTTDDDGLWDHAHPAFSPDGRTLCYADFRNLWLVDVADGSTRRLTSKDAFDSEPQFSPDGSLVFFSSWRQSVLAVWAVPASGGPARRVTEGTGSERHPALSRDGRVLATSTYVRDSDILILDRVSKSVERISSTVNDETPVLLPDGSGVFFASNRAGRSDLWLQPLDRGRPSGPVRRLTSFEEGDPATPAVSRDGRWISFIRVLAGQRDIWILPTTGGAARRIVGDPAQDIHPSLSPDAGRLVFASSRSGVEHLFTVPLRDGVATEDPRPLTSGESADVFPAFSPDGSQVAFLRGEDIWVVGADGGAEPRRVTSGARPNHFAWDAGGDAFVVAGLFGGRRLVLRRVLLDGGRVEPIDPAPDLGGEIPAGYLSVSADGRFVAVQAGRLQADIWVRSPFTGGS
ncbi:MAG TPA: protein kinase [Thermoanaerobaculia bacterium]|nr:protein kinase [Thermoanaerobaculia bacterium]